MKNIIVTLIIILVLTLAVTCIVKQKKNGVKCIGCPSGKNCPYKGKGCTPKH